MEAAGYADRRGRLQRGPGDEAAPDHQESVRGLREPEVQYGHRSHDGPDQ